MTQTEPQWYEPDGTATTPGLHAHYAIWDHEGQKWDPTTVERIIEAEAVPEQARDTGGLRERIEALPRHTSPDGEETWLEWAAVRDILSEERP